MYLFKGCIDQMILLLFPDESNFIQALNYFFPVAAQNIPAYK